MKNFWKIFLLFALLFEASCARYMANIFPSRPDSEMDFSDASPEFRKGWEDGCEVGMAGGSNNFYKMFYRNNKADGYLMAGSPDYKSAWGVGFWYCYRYDYVKQKGSIWGSYFTGYR